jgi:hypothetical protein
MSSRRPVSFLVALALAVGVLGACDTNAPAPPLGTFEVDVTGDIEASASGTAWVAEPDSGLNVGDMEWEVGIRVGFRTTAGDSVRVSFYVGEPTEPNGPFTELPEGTFTIDAGSHDRARPVVFVGVAFTSEFLEGTDGRVTLRRRPDGSVEGEVSTRYVAINGWSGPTYRGWFDLRFHALAEPPPL